jgi:hypothetical protein
VIAGILVSVACLVLVTLAMLPERPERPGVTKANLDRIKAGMTLEEVEDILGKSSKQITFAGEIHHVWKVDDENYVGIRFIEGRSREGHWGSPAKTFFEKLRHWLNLP